MSWVRVQVNMLHFGIIIFSYNIQRNVLIYQASDEHSANNDC